MSDVPANLRYTKSHEWVKDLGDGTCMVGVTDHAQDQLGDMVYVEVPEVDTHYAAEDACAVVESVKAASDVYSPVSGEVVEVNEELADAPELVNQSPYENGWIMKIKPDDMSVLAEFMDADAYSAMIAEEH